MIVFADSSERKEYTSKTGIYYGVSLSKKMYGVSYQNVISDITLLC